MGEALYDALRARRAGRRLPRLCAGRRPSRSARLSGAAAAGERRQLLVRVGGGRSGRADRDHPEAAAGLDRIARAGAASAHPAAARSVRAGARAIRRASNSATVQSLDALLAEIAAAPRPAHVPAHSIARRRPDGARAAERLSRHWCGDAGRSARRRGAASAPAICSKQRRGLFLALLQSEGGKTLDDARRRIARGDRLLPLLRRAGAQDAGPAGDAGADRRIATNCAIAGAACSSASRRGIFRWRFSWARSTAALVAGNAVVAKPAEQTPLIACEAVRLLHEAGVPTSALQLVLGDGKVGAALIADRARRGRGLHRLDRGRRTSSTARSRPRTARSCR